MHWQRWTGPLLTASPPLWPVVEAKVRVGRNEWAARRNASIPFPLSSFPSRTYDRDQNHPTLVDIAVLDHLNDYTFAT